jgi:hypothetical protein
MLTSVFGQTTTNSLTGVRMCAWLVMPVQVDLTSGTTKHVLATTIPTLKGVGFTIISCQYTLVLMSTDRDTTGSITNRAGSLCHFTNSSIITQANISQTGAITMAKFTIACIFSPIILKYG